MLWKQLCIFLIRIWIKSCHFKCFKMSDVIVSLKSTEFSLIRCLCIDRLFIAKIGYSIQLCNTSTGWAFVIIIIAIHSALIKLFNLNVPWISFLNNNLSVVFGSSWCSDQFRIALFSLILISYWMSSSECSENLTVAICS